jgi:hypothetical protein
LKSFESGGERIFLKGQQGIFKPAELPDPLSITSTLDSPYNDGTVEGLAFSMILRRSHASTKTTA